MMASVRPPVAVIGGGGHAKVVISTLQAAGYPVAGVFDDSPEKWGSELLGCPVRGPIDALAGSGCPAAVIAIGSNEVRKQIAGRFLEIEWATVVHPGATVHSSVHSSVQLGPGTVVFAGAVIQPDSVLGAHVIVNTGATVDHDCAVGDYVHLAPGSHLAGSVRIGEGAFLGIGSAVTPGRQVGEWTIVGAGAVVVRDLPDNITAVGVPARPMKKDR
jgi:sugar O-acyltransferase (sialic acid O-acetyltransferase NeuD family)